MRGKLLVYVPIVLLRGITPAGAGKTRLQQEPPLFSRDHPRRCGENGTVLTGQLFRRGSPPQVRGKPKISPTRCTANRITPAGAGKTAFALTYFQIGKDHPRRCGENKYPHCVLVSNMGSPPQVRGKPGKAKPYRVTDRITPAGAGKTGGGELSGGDVEDHPRRCGENQ